MDQTLNVLIEGYDESKLEEVSYQENWDKDWESVYRSRQTGTIMQADVLGIEENQYGTKTIPCAVVYVGHVKGIIPMEMMNVTDYQELRKQTGQKVAFKVIGIDKENKIFIGSRNAAIEHMANATWKKIKEGLLQEGSTILGVVRNVERKELHIDIGGVIATMDVTEYDYGWIDSLPAVVSVGDHIRCKILSIDMEEKKVTLSRKALLPNPWLTLSERISVGGEYVGRVTGVVNQGYYINLMPGVDSFARHMMRTTLKRGDQVLVRLIAIDTEEEKITARVVRKI